MQRENSISATAPVLAAQYVRMSDEAQQYSIDNQKAAIQEYAVRHGFVIVKTYADVGKSGVVAKNRKALGELLRDVGDCSRTTMRLPITNFFVRALEYLFTIVPNHL